MIKAIICDYGSVLAQTLDPQPRATWERKLGLAPGELTRIVHNDDTWIAAQRGEIPVEAHWQAVGARLGLSAAELAVLRRDFYRGDVVNALLVTHLKELRSAGYRTAILSNFSTELRALLAHQHLLPLFDLVTISAEIGVMKPEVAAYRLTLSLLGLPPEACVFIDDQPVNVEAAIAQGLHGIVFRDNASCLPMLQHLLSSS